MGIVYGTGLYEKGDVIDSPLLKEAYEMGLNVH